MGIENFSHVESMLVFANDHDPDEPGEYVVLVGTKKSGFSTLAMVDGGKVHLMDFGEFSWRIGSFSDGRWALKGPKQMLAWIDFRLPDRGIILLDESEKEFSFIAPEELYGN